MFCKNCGKELTPEAVACEQCGFQKGMGNRFCANCGNEPAPGAVVCGRCGCATNPASANAVSGEAKSKLAAGLLGIFLGGLGIHNFYLGFTKKAVIQLLLGTVGAVACGLGPIASGIWGLVEGILILCGNENKDANGNILKD